MFSAGRPATARTDEPKMQRKRAALKPRNKTIRFVDAQRGFQPASPFVYILSVPLSGTLHFVLRRITEHRSVLLSRKSFAGRKGFFFAESSRSSRLRGESWAGLSPRRREAREENGRTLVWLRLCCSVFIGGLIRAFRGGKLLRGVTISLASK